MPAHNRVDAAIIQNAVSIQWDISEAKTRVEELINRAREGEEIVVAEDGHPIVKVSPMHQSNGRRIFGEYSGKVRVSDDFTAPLSLR